MIRRSVFCALLALGTLTPVAAAAARPPNIVVIMTDDVDFNEISCYADGRGKVWTPHIDSIIQGGMRFDRMRVVTPVCVPSRFATLTGRYASRSRAYDTIPADRTVSVENINSPRLGMAAPTIGPGEKTIAHFLRERGYVTGLFGKHHNDKTAVDYPVENRAAVKAMQNRPGGEHDPATLAEIKHHYDETVARVTRDTGFDEVGRLYYDNKEVLPVPAAFMFDNSPWITEGAIRFIKRHEDKPFFLYYSSPLPHGQTVSEGQKGKRLISGKTRQELIELDPRGTPSGWWENPSEVQPSRDDALRRAEEHAPDYFGGNALMTWLDDSVGALLATLRDRGLEENTIIVFMSDHQSGGKFLLYDDGARVPFAISWKGHITPGSKSDILLGSIDVLPTLLELIGAPPAPKGSLDGVSFAGALTDPKQEVRDSLLLEIGYARALVTHDWKYIALRFPAGITAPAPGNNVTWPGNIREQRRRQEITHPAYLDRDQLFDLRRDPDERRNVFADEGNRAVATHLSAQLAAILATFPHAFDLPRARVEPPTTRD